MCHEGDAAIVTALEPIWNSKCYVIREHLLSVTVHPISTYFNNNPTLTPMGLLNTNNILFWKDETVGMHNNIRPKVNAIKISSTKYSASCT